MKKVTIMALAAAAIMSSCKNKEQETQSAEGTERSFGELQIRTAVRGEAEGMGYGISPTDSLLSFTNVILSDVWNGKLQAYALPDSTEPAKPVSIQEIIRANTTVDTIFVFDPKTEEEERGIATNSFKAEDISGIKLKEKWLYNAEAKTFQTVVSEIYFMRRLIASDGTVMGEKGVFLVKLNQK